MSPNTFKLNASEHAIKSVTIFKSSKAEVVRTFALELKKGQNKIEIKGLSSWIDRQTVRVSGLGDARLFDVTCTCESSKATLYMADSPAEVRRNLLVKKSELESERTVIEQESKLLLKYGETLTGEHVTTTQMAQFLESYVDRGRKIVQAVTKLNEDIVNITRQIELLDEKTVTKHGTAFGKVDITIVADSDVSVDLKLTYIVSQVQWTPTYELHATTENGKPSSSVSLHYRARVRQCTGEDWDNTSLTLSTIASDTIAKRIPQLRPVKLQAKSPFQQGQARTQNSPFTKLPNNNVNPSIFGPSNTNSSRNFNAFQPQPQQPALFQQPSAFQSQPASGLFASAQQHQQQQAPTLFGGGGGFGQPTGGFGAFGATQANPPPAPAALAQQQQQQAPTLFGGGRVFGQPSGGNGGGGGFGATLATPPAPPAAFAAFGSGSFGSLFGTSTSAAAPPAQEPSQQPQDPAAQPEEEKDDNWELYDPEHVPTTEPGTIVSETPVAISFSVHGESTIPTDGVEHQVSVAILPFEATVSYICIPRIDPRVYLECVVKNTSEYRLLPGPVTVIFDDSYVSKTSINDINTGDNFECTLGDDPSTKVTYARTFKTVKSSGGAFAEVTNTTTYKTKISIHNKHQFAITDLVVREVVPTLEDKDKRASIVLRTPKGLADAKDGETVDLKDGLRVEWEPLVDGKGGEKEGRFVWRWGIGSGAKINLEAEWEVKAPGEEAWTEVY